jgi:hypothetical protein
MESTGIADSTGELACEVSNEGWCGRVTSFKDKSNGWYAWGGMGANYWELLSTVEGVLLTGKCKSDESCSAVSQASGRSCRNNGGWTMEGIGMAGSGDADGKKKVPRSTFCPGTPDETVGTWGQVWVKVDTRLTFCREEMLSTGPWEKV